ncbi:putative glutamate--cysteine ligase [Candidatus Fokinia solitaria]|uniref:Putative glutamate--cysteine ligase n=1 Tax=Candidatus Fokinia solitaria TaxID=1802984 RepID=A0A2U8BRE3_9RICK|nr:glutamate--cysteine ligase [Candidatus Fokinia solitaria]AWD32907.1 putative glutamate--cysteine ligase [Candidatus Fokinia solitaria]
MKEYSKICALLSEKKEMTAKWYKELVDRYTANDIVVPLYYSIDFRESCYKSTVVDCNMFPAGFMHVRYNEEIVQAFQKYISEYTDKFRKSISAIYLIPENFTRNSFYIRNVVRLSKILREVALRLKVEFSLLLDTDNELLFIELQDAIMNFRQLPILQYNTTINDDALIILNKDLTNGMSSILSSAKSVLPNPLYGWYRRSKYNFFQKYEALAVEVSKILNCDSWFFCSLISYVSMSGDSWKSESESLALAVDSLIKRISEKYALYGIKDAPKVFVKSDNGTFGRANIAVFSGDDIRKLNKKNREELYKSGIENNFVIQECVYSTLCNENEKLFLSSLMSENASCERMLYTIGGQHHATLLRTNTKKGSGENLNTPGMSIANIDHIPYSNPLEGLIVQLTTLATMEELSCIC